jgi:uncharacterized protein (DUF305 family)
MRCLRSILAIAALLTAATPSAHAQLDVQIRTDSAALAKARTDSIRHPYTKADIDFANGMVLHHAQAVRIANWCSSHGASAEVLTLCARIINAQIDEIHRMQQWLVDRRQPISIPDTSRAAASPSAMANMPGMHMHSDSAMPGMLTAAGLDSLDATRGRAFDRLFLSSMIHHHQGAVAMVNRLYGTRGAGQDDVIFKLASDISADQTTEIARMQRLLATIVFGRTPP